MKTTQRHSTKSIRATLTIPGSKSITNRALLIAALADGVSEIFNIQISDDTRAFIQALHELGVVVQLDEEDRSCIVGGGSGQFPKEEASIWCESSGITARFLLAACASAPGKFYFDGTEQLRHRPLKPLIQILERQGTKFSPKHPDTMPFSLIGDDGLAGGEIEVEGSESSQFLSALLIAAPLAKSPFVLITHDLVSRPYVDMTCTMMAEFGVLVHRMHQARFSVPVPQRYQAHDYVVEPDLSTASYFFAAAAVTAGEVTIQAIDRAQSKQADVKFLQVLERMGCHLEEKESGLTVIGAKELNGVNVDMRDFSDTFMTLAAIAPFANSPTTMTNIAHVRLKESDRIKVMRQELEKLKIKVEEGEDWLKVYPSKPTPGKIDSHHDHRIAMAFSVIQLRVPEIEIGGAKCVSKTCPEFFELWKKMQGK